MIPMGHSLFDNPIIFSTIDLGRGSHGVQLDKDGLLTKFALAYVDEVVCSSRSVGEHFVQLRAIFDNYRTSGMKLDPKKCSFLSSEVVYQGNLLNASGFGPDPNKVKAMMELPVPISQQLLKRALGMLRCYKNYIQFFFTLVAPLNRLLKNAGFYWTEVEQVTFETLRERLKNAPFTQYPKDDGVFMLEIEASAQALGESSPVHISQMLPGNLRKCADSRGSASYLDIGSQAVNLIMQSPPDGYHTGSLLRVQEAERMDGRPERISPEPTVLPVT